MVTIQKSVFRLYSSIEMQNFLKEREIPIDLDDFSGTSGAVFAEEENCLRKQNAFKLLSMLSCVFMDLGILCAITQRS